MDFALTPIITRWLFALLVTLAVELPVFALLGRGYAPTTRCIGGGALGTLITHPLLWFAWRHTFDSYLLRTITGELLVCLIEGIVLWRVARPLKFKSALGISLVANGASYGLGILLHTLGFL